LGNISIEPEEIAGLLFSFPQLIFHEAKIEYDDDSLAERLMKRGAEEQQVTIEDFKKVFNSKMSKKKLQKKKTILPKKR